MSRKTLKQKLKTQVRKVNDLRQLEHEQAGITINYELESLQSVCLAHGIMASLITAKQVLGENSEAFKRIQEQSQARIAQCYVKLVEMGIDPVTANQRIMVGR